MQGKAWEDEGGRCAETKEEGFGGRRAWREGMKGDGCAETKEESSGERGDGCAKMGG